MAREERLQIIEQVEEARNSRVLVYVTGDRRGLETKIASDVFPFFLDHLRGFGQTPRIDLFLYTAGGLTIAASGLVGLIREFAATLSVLIPFKAHSSGTLIALGADSLVMSHVTQLSPVDPTVTSPYNPSAPGQPQGQSRVLPVNVEDVIGFLDLAKDELGLESETALASAFQNLTSQVHPLALGGVYRAREQIRFMARKMLKSHADGGGDEETIERVVSTLTRELYSHDYIIGRNEAIEALKLPVEDPNPETDNLVWALYEQYAELLQLTVPYNQDVVLGERSQAIATFTRGIIESSASTHAFQTTREITRLQVTPPGAPGPVTGFQDRTIEERWIANAEV